MSDSFPDLPRFPESGKDPGRPPLRRWSPVAVGLAGVAAVAGLVAALVAFGDPEVRVLLFAGWLFLAYLAVRFYGLWIPDDEAPPRSDE